MKHPTMLDKSTLNLEEIAKQCKESSEFGFNNRSIKYIIDWLNTEDIYFFDRYEKGFEDWDEEDYCNNMSVNKFDPYAIFIGNYVIMHDYC